jgi:hypothetical protein
MIQSIVPTLRQRTSEEAEQNRIDEAGLNVVTLSIEYPV